MKFWTEGYLFISSRMSGCKLFRLHQNRNKTLTCLAVFWCLVFLWINANYTDEDLLKWISVKDEKLKDPLLNKHRFAYFLDTDVCQKRNIDVIIVVHTAVDNFLRRMKSRDTWAGVTKVDQHSIATVFMVGLTTNQTLQESLLQEAQTYKDIVQGNFIDSYKNLTYKHIMALGWVRSHCPAVKLIVKTDDDVLINLFNMAAYISQHGFQNNFLYCYLFSYAFPKRMSGEKWYVGYSEYPFMMYPDFCSGAAYLASPDVAKKLFDASSDVRFFWIDDLYVTGFLALKTGVRHTSMVAGHDFVNTSSLTKDSMFLDAQHIWYSHWDFIVKSVPKTLKYQTKYKS